MLNVTLRNVTALVDALEKDGFVLRKDHPTDRRAIVLDLSEKGQRASARLKEEAHEFAQELFGNMEAELSRACSMHLTMSRPSLNDWRREIPRACQSRLSGATVIVIKAGSDSLLTPRSAQSTKRSCRTVLDRPLEMKYSKLLA